MISVKEVVTYTKKLNVLYVEDDIDLLRTTKQLFNNFFNKTDTAKNGQEALEQYNLEYQKNNAYYHLIITDSDMPIMDGMKLCKSIFKINTNQAIIIISAHNEDAYLAPFIELGINEYMFKALNNKQIIDTIYKIAKTIDERN